MDQGLVWRGVRGWRCAEVRERKSKKERLWVRWRVTASRYIEKRVWSPENAHYF